jgi:hypothetical protein
MPCLQKSSKTSTDRFSERMGMMIKDLSIKTIPAPGTCLNASEHLDLSISWPFVKRAVPIVI